MSPANTTPGDLTLHHPELDLFAVVHEYGLRVPAWCSSRSPHMLGITRESERFDAHDGSWAVGIGCELAGCVVEAERGGCVGGGEIQGAVGGEAAPGIEGPCTAQLLKTLPVSPAARASGGRQLERRCDRMLRTSVSLGASVSLQVVRVSRSCCSRLPALPGRSAPGLRRENIALAA